VDVTIMVMYMTPTGIGDTAFNDVVPKNSRKTYNMSEKACQLTWIHIRVMRDRRGDDNGRACHVLEQQGAGTGTIGTGIE